MVTIMDLNELIRESLKKYYSYEVPDQIQEEGWIYLNTTENSYPRLFKSD